MLRVFKLFNYFQILIIFRALNSQKIHNIFYTSYELDAIQKWCLSDHEWTVKFNEGWFN